MNRFDIHVNLGSFPGSKKGKQQRYISPQEMDEYFTSHNITHSLVLYNRDEYELLRELGTITKTKIYGVQCVMGIDKDNPTDENNLPVWDINTEGRSFKTGGYCYGIKIASNRGWWIRDEKVDSGIDYHNPIVDSIFSSLPKDSIVSMHTQGSTVTNPQRNDGPKTMLNYGAKYRELKFIINHCGDYGPALRVSRPGKEPNFWKYNGESFLRYINHRARVVESLTYTELGHNLFGDMSCYTYSKGEVASHNYYTMWTVGSDFPFSENLPLNYSTERENFLKWTDFIPDDNAVRFFESTHEELVQWCHERCDDSRATVNKHRKKRREERKREELTDVEQRMIIGRVDHIVDEKIIPYYEEYTSETHKQEFKDLLTDAIKYI